MLRAETADQEQPARRRSFSPTTEGDRHAIIHSTGHPEPQLPADLTKVNRPPVSLLGGKEGPYPKLILVILLKDFYALLNYI